MCGIAGIIDRAGVPGRAALERARDTLAHRGPDDAGTYVNERGDAALLFRRLAIIDLSPAGHQPLQNENGRRWIVFNGEVYNFEELRPALEAAGHRFRSKTDSEVILHAYEEWGEACVQRFIGMFAFAIWDEDARTLFVARDRLGIKPLYYRQDGTSLRFGSELKTIGALGADRRVDPAALWEYLNRGYVVPPRSIDSGTASLPPGHWLRWSLDTGTLTVERYWDPVEAYARGPGRTGSDPRSLEEAAEALDALLRSAVKLRLRSDVPFGAFLSGGLDSSLVVSIMAAVADTTVKTFTIGFESRAYDEAPAARRLAAQLGTEHHELLATDRQVLDFIPRLVDYFDEPFADSSALPTYLVCLLARPHVTVALSGDGGDELFAGYQHHRMIHDRYMAARRLPSVLRAPATAAARMLPASRVRSGLQSLRSAAAAETFFDYFTSIWRPEELARLAPDLAPAATVAASRTNGATPPLDVFMLSDLQRYLPDDILTKVDRASMAVSLEARVPLLDHRVVEFVLALPLDMKIRGGLQKVLLRHVLSRYVPADLLGRPKHGFAVPLDHWLRGPLAGLIDHYLDQTRLRAGGLFDPRVVASMVQRFKRGAVGHARVWALLVYQMWAEKYGVA